MGNTGQKYTKPKVSQPKPEKGKIVRTQKSERPVKPKKPTKPITPVNLAVPSEPQEPNQIKIKKK